MKSQGSGDTILPGMSEIPGSHPPPVEYSSFPSFFHPDGAGGAPISSSCPRQLFLSAQIRHWSVDFRRSLKKWLFLRSPDSSGNQSGAGSFEQQECAVWALNHPDCCSFALVLDSSALLPPQMCQELLLQQLRQHNPPDGPSATLRSAPAAPEASFVPPFAPFRVFIPITEAPRPPGNGISKFFPHKGWGWIFFSLRAPRRA